MPPYASVFGYVFEVGGITYSGIFAILTNEEQAKRLQNSLADSVIRIRYNPADPDNSVLEDIHDPQFEGLTGMQDPLWLDEDQDPDVEMSGLSNR